VSGLDPALDDPGVSERVAQIQVARWSLADVSTRQLRRRERSIRGRRVCDDEQLGWDGLVEFLAVRMELVQTRGVALPAPWIPPRGRVRRLIDNARKTRARTQGA
jgi:hypothetical protein